MTFGFTMNSRDLELRSMKKFLTKEGKKPKEIHERMNAEYGDVSPSYYEDESIYKSQMSISLISFVHYAFIVCRQMAAYVCLS